MKGVVEIYKVGEDGSSELLLSEENLIMDGASESIVDFLTMPSSVAIVDGVVKEKVLDTSNYIIQGFTTAKGKLGYLNNAHKYKKHNFIVSGSNFDDTVYFSNPNCRVQKDNSYSPLDLSSEVFSLTTINPSTASSYLEFSGFSDHLDNAINTPLLFTVDLKYNFQYPPEKVSSGANSGRSLTTLRIDRHGSQLSGTVQWIESPSKVVCTTLEGNVLVKDLGSGWYRVGLVSPSGVDSGGLSSVILFPTGEGTERNFTSTSPSGGMLMTRPSVTMGSIPINYYLGSETLFDSDKDTQEYPVLTSSLPNVEDQGSSSAKAAGVSAIVVPNDPGTLRSNASAYDPIMSLPQVQDPKYTGIEPGSVTDYANCVDADVKADHNLNFAGFVGYDFNVYEYLNDGWTVHSDLTGHPAMADLRWFGGYGFPQKTDFSITSGLELSSYNNFVHTQSRAKAGINVARSCDPFGYIRARYYELGESLTSPYFLLCKLSNPYEGYVEYEVKLIDYDVATLNYFGGTTILGMYSLDYREMLKNGLSLDSSVNKTVLTGDDMKFRLFCRKVFNENINATSDILSTPTAGNSLNTALTIKWRINFL